MGVAGISFDDFCRLRMEEVDEILRACGEKRSQEIHTQWEVMRLQTVMILAPFCQNVPQPKRLLPLPWDNETEEPEEPETPLSQEERTANERRLREKLGW